MTEQFFIAQPVATDQTETFSFREGIAPQTFPMYRCGDLLLRWSGEKPPPAIGQKIRITMNGIGPAIVKGYFAGENYLGVMTLALDPPEWLRKQKTVGANRPNAPQWMRDGIGCQFGTEIEY